MNPHYWLASAEALDELRFAETQQPTEHHLRRVEARQAAVRSGIRPQILTQSANVATIHVDGVLTHQPSVLAMLLGGGTSYVEIQAAIEQAEADPSVTEIVYALNSPGGGVDGLFETIDAIQRGVKKRRAVAMMACSAAYALAAAAGNIEASSRASEFGSIGVATSIRLRPDVVDVTSTDAPDKRPDVSTDAGRATVRALLDQVHSLFVEAIALGRGVTTSTVNATYGRGASMLADEAKRLGLIDSIRPSPTTAGPMPRRLAGESAESFQTRIRAWSSAAGEMPPLAQLNRELTALEELRNPSAPSPHQTVGAGNDFGDQLAEHIYGRKAAKSDDTTKPGVGAGRDFGDQLAAHVYGPKSTQVDHKPLTGEH